MNSAESLVPASIRIACSSVEGASTLSEARVVGLYQYIYCVLLLPERDDAFNVPGATSTETGVFCELRVYGVLRSSHSGDSAKFVSKILHSPAWIGAENSLFPRPST